MDDTEQAGLLERISSVHQKQVSYLINHFIVFPFFLNQYI
jgi:hypothetical protein